MDTSKSVLLVDDDPVFLQTLGRSLQRKQFHVTMLSESTAALAAIEASRFDLVLLDLNLAGESGLKLLIDMLRIQPEARIVMLTAYASVATAVDAIKRGADNYLCKPIKTSDIVALFEAEPIAADEEEVEPEHPMSVDRLEWEHVQRVLMENDGNISATARALNMHRRTLQRKLQKRPVKK
ncbi:response regulator transcription factor [Ketobacter sp.]|nr:MAG: response regulator [Ketobacter sp.]